LISLADREKAEETPKPKAVLIGMSEESDQFLAAIQRGVAGYLLKEASAAEVVAAVRATYRGEAVCPPKLCATLFQFVSKVGSSSVAVPTRGAARPSLTLRQQRLIALVAKGLTNKEIASRLNISEFTVKNHIHRILKNVDADSRTEAVEAVRSHGYALNVADHAHVADHPHLNSEARHEAIVR
jgi:DNA-binding NarL/FixJ family response regulator